MKALTRIIMPCFAAMVAVLLIHPAPSVAEEDAGPARKHFKYSQWAHPAERAGFVFTKSDYAALSGYTITKDETSFTGATHFQEAGEVAGGVTRLLAMENDQSATVSVAIAVCPTSKLAVNFMLTQFEGFSGPSPYHACSYGPDHGITLGDASIVGKPRPEDTGTAQEADIRFLWAKRRNVAMMISRSEGSTFNVVDLARKMIEKMDAQYTAGTATTRPAVTLTLADDKVETSDAGPVELSFTHQVTPSAPEKTVTKLVRVFSVTNRYIATDGSSVADPDNNHYPSGPAADTPDVKIDDKDNPTAVVIATRSQRGHYFVGVVAWEENLFPIIVCKKFEAKDPS